MFVFSVSAGKHLPLSQGDNDLSVLSVSEPTCGQNKQQPPVAKGFQAYVFEPKLDTLTNSMNRVNLTPPKVFSRKMLKLTLNWANFQEAWQRAAKFSSIQKKYLRPENCEFLKAPQVNPELWDDLKDKTKSRECSFQSFQKNVI